MSNNTVLSILQDKMGFMLFGTYDGLNKYDGAGFTAYQYSPDDPNSISSNQISAIFEDSYGVLWIGNVHDGLNRFDREKEIFVLYDHNPGSKGSLSNNNVSTIFEDSRKDLWIVTAHGGLNLYDLETDSFIHFYPDSHGKTDIGSKHITSIAEDQNGFLWLGSSVGKLIRFDVKTNQGVCFDLFSDDHGDLLNPIYHKIYIDSDNNIWFGTEKGLYFYDQVKDLFQHFQEGNTSKHLNENLVADVIELQKDLFLIATGHGGLNVYNKQTGTFTYHMYSEIHESTLSNDQVIHLYRSPDGIICIGNFQGGINIFDPESKTLSHKQSSIALEFAALNYSNPQKNQYAYKLEGVDSEWNYIGNRHSVNYTNLYPGNYVFMVKGSNNDGVWNEDGASLRITILPSWWKTWWFNSIFYILVTGLIVFLYLFVTAFQRRQQKKLLILVKERTCQLEEAANILEKQQEEIKLQNERLRAQRDKLENANRILLEQKQQILDQNKELDKHRNRLELLVEERTTELISAKEKVEESDRLKSSFLANMSHEIRTPLNAILGFSTLITAKKIKDDIKREKYNAIIQNSCNNLLNLINDILEISKIESGQLELNVNEVLLNDVINDMIGVFNLIMLRQETVQNKKIPLKINIDKTILKTRIITDKLRLEQILTNLISNAIKFTCQGYIEIGCMILQDKNMLQFHVKDTGIGIKKMDQEYIFERFRKVEQDESQMQKGTGLGLTISKQLVQMLGGSIFLTSKTGEGSIFYFTIPLIKSHSVSHPDRTILYNNKVPEFQNYRILIAEDDDSNYIYIRQLLRSTHAKIIHAVNGREVIKIIKNRPEIHLILMDIRMPEMNGIKTLHEIRKLNIKIPVIAQTAYSLEDEVDNLIKEGFDDYISKPIQSEHLYKILGKYLDGN
ncbi:MAG: response regulator [Bacteroidales bacterium]|nr:response regulator [Bacteroidales bacterium]